MPRSDQPSQPDSPFAYRQRLAASGDWVRGSQILQDRIAQYVSDNPVEVAGVDAESLRRAARVLDIAADIVDEYAASLAV